MRLLLFTGKGGVGKTTVAAATAVHAARCGVKTLLVSTDAAHSLGDAVGVELGDRPVEVESGLSAFQVDVRRRGERSWRAVQEYLLELLDTLGVDPVAAEELTVLPGADEVLALLEVRDEVVGGLWDLVVVDCAPTAETLRLLALPEALSRVLERALPVERRLLRAMARRGTGRGAGAAGLPAPRDVVVEAAERLHAELAQVREVLTAPTSSVRLVLTPEAVVLAETRRTWTSLALYGYPVDAVVANRLVPADGADPWRSARAQAQSERLAEADASFAPVPVLRAGFAASEPVGADALAELGEELYGPVCTAAAEAVLAPPQVADLLAVQRDGDEFVLALSLPLAARPDVDLSRAGDDLVVVVGSHRRVIALPSALRRCVVVGARLRDGVLAVRFRPDPDLWRPM